MDLHRRTVDDLANDLPGAAEVFHRNRIDVCTSRGVSARRAAIARGLDPAALEVELQTLNSAEPAVPVEPRALIAHILSRYHATHLRELPEAIRLATMVEAVHRYSDRCPFGLADHLEVMADDLEQHQQKEEAVLFPLMLAGGGPMLRFPIARMNQEHDEVERQLAVMANLTANLTAPPDACGSWNALYVLCRKITDDLREHMRLEAEVLFPQFAADTD